MRYELDLVRASVTPDPAQVTTVHRRDLRVVTDRLIHDALLVNELPALVGLSAEVMVTVATILATYEIEPGVPDFVEASQALIEAGRGVMDRGLLLRSWETTQCGAVMLELTVRGICATLSVPYDKVLAEVHRARQAGENPLVRQILVEAGLIAAVPPDGVARDLTSAENGPLSEK